MSNIKELNKVDLNNDGIGYVQQYDFSRANVNYESRVEAITTIASVCYANPKAIGSTKLYDRLAMENKGLPSSSYEFVPILLTIEQLTKILELVHSNTSELDNIHCIKFGTFIEFHLIDAFSEDEEVDPKYIITNLRALIHDIGDEADNEEYYNNTEEEINIIKKHFKVFRSDMDLNTARQFVRHRTNLQELSRRYVSGKKKEFSFYISEGMEDLTSSIELVNKNGASVETILSTEKIIDICVNHYKEAMTTIENEDGDIIRQGLKAEEARRILPQAMYTTIWSAWQPFQMEVFFKLRLDSHAQREIRWLAEGMDELLAQEIIEDNGIEIIKHDPSKTEFNYKEECKDCSMLVELRDGEWSCDDTGLKCSDIEECSFNNL